MTLYMPLFRSCTTLRSLTQLHAHLLVTGLHNDPQASTKLIESYAQKGALQSSELVFKTFQAPDSFMWAVLIKCHVWSNSFGEAISLYNNMTFHAEARITSFVFPSVLRACAGFGDLGIGGKVHGRLIKCRFDSDIVTETSLMAMYGELGCLSDARKVFDLMSVRDVVSWSTIISSYIDNGAAGEGLEMFRLLVSEGIELDSVTLLSVVEACGELGLLRLARSVHGYMMRRRIETCSTLDNSVIVAYGKCDDLLSAEKIFQNVVDPSVTTCTAMISCYNRSGQFKQGLKVFVEMLQSKVEPSIVTIMSILGSCTGLGWLREGKSVHCYAFRKNMDLKDDSLGPALIELYVECGNLVYGENVLHTVGERSIISWNMLMSVYAHRGLLKEALLLFVQMCAQGLMPDTYSLSVSFLACKDLGSLQLGHQIQGHAIKRNFLDDDFVLNSMVDMYCKCGCVDSAYLIFNKVKQKSVINWNSMICGFSQNGNSLQAIWLFDKMYLNSFEMNEVSFLMTIQACSHLGHLEKGKWLHHKVIAHGMTKDLYIDTALIDMYAKCGDLQTAQRVFDNMSERSVVSWSVMISAYGMHGHINGAILYFNHMVELGIKPNDITFMNILSACSHSGYVQEGKSYFNLMRNFGIEPSTEHFACMVDLLSRAGDLSGAYRTINSMPFPADATIWGAFLNGCRIHQRMDIIQSIKGHLLNMSTDDTGYYTLLSNIYAEEGYWGACRKVRSVMQAMGLKKVPGYSTIELDKRTYRFGAGDASHSHIKEIYIILENFQRLAREEGYFVESYSPYNICVQNTFANDSESLAIANEIGSILMETGLNKPGKPSYLKRPPSVTNNITPSHR